MYGLTVLWSYIVKDLRHFLNRYRSLFMTKTSYFSTSWKYIFIFPFSSELWNVSQNWGFKQRQRWCFYYCYSCRVKLNLLLSVIFSYSIFYVLAKWNEDLPGQTANKKPNLSQFEFQTSYYISSSIVILALQTYQISDKVEKTQWDVSLIMKERDQYGYFPNTNIILLLGKFLEFDFTILHLSMNLPDELESVASF